MKVSDDVLKSIGTLTLECTELETLVELGIWRLIGTKGAGPVVTAHMTFPHKRETLLALIDYKMPEHKDFHKALNKELDQAVKLFRRRNDLVHSTWDLNKPDTYALRRARGRFEYKDVPTSAAEIDQVTSELVDLEVRIIDLYRQNGLWPDS